MQIPLPLPVTGRKSRAGRNNAESRQLRILLPATWSGPYSVRVALKRPCLFRDSVVRGSLCLHHLVHPTAVRNAAVRLRPQTNIPFQVQPHPLFVSHYFFCKQ